ncbi:hypothetical protein OHS70_38435 (plasmid) [Streptomyces sp. NBC_00390]
MTGLDLLEEDIGPEVRELAKTLRMLLDSLGISLRRYAARTYCDPGTVSRYLNGKRVPPWSFVMGLLTQVAEHRGEPVTAEAISRLRTLHRKAVSAGTSNRRVQELQLLLEEQDQEVRESQAREQALAELLHERQHRLRSVQIELRAVEAARATDREEHRTALDRARAEQARLRAERDSLSREVTSLRTQLDQARQTRELAEERCARLECLLDAGEHGPSAPQQSGDSPVPALPLLPPRDDLAAARPPQAHRSGTPVVAPSRNRREPSASQGEPPGPAAARSPAMRGPEASRAAAKRSVGRRRALLTALAVVTALATASDIQAPAAALIGHTNAVFSVAFSPDGKTLATGSKDGTVRLWNTGTRRQIGARLTEYTFYVFSVAFSPDGKTLATGSADGTVQLWDTATRIPTGNPLSDHTDLVLSVVFSPDGKTLATAGWDGTRLWDTATRTSIGDPLTGHWGNSVGVQPGWQDPRHGWQRRHRAAVAALESLRRCRSSVLESGTADVRLAVTGVGRSPCGRLDATGPDHRDLP